MDSRRKKKKKKKKKKNQCLIEQHFKTQFTQNRVKPYSGVFKESIVMF